ncbi:hypothetical protein [Propionivibrio sp.]|uniref:hypothetical protein n=1 Tax=Propionivibrio sp. TaxID=2212460 RepID=UPI003BF59F85
MGKTALAQYDVLPIKLESALHRQLAASGQTQCSPQQWLGILRNLQQKGVSGAEIEWSGIITRLESHPALKVHINELLAPMAGAPPCELVLQRRITDAFAPIVRYVKVERPAEFPPEIIRRGRREVRFLHYRDRSFGLSIWLHVEVDTGIFGRHKYWSFSVPSGRKHLPSFTVGKQFSSASEAMAYGRELVARMEPGFVGPVKSLNRFTRFALPSGDHYTEWLITAPNLPVDYWGHHFAIRNIVAHVRTTERPTPQGFRLLVMEEIQSDWNQVLREAIQAQARRHPIADETIGLSELDDIDQPPFNPYQNHWLDAALRMMLLLAAHKGLAGIAWLPGQVHAERFHWANAHGLKVFYDQIVPSAVEKLAKSWGATLGEAQFATLSRCFGVRRLTGSGNWRVMNLDSRQLIADEFPDFDSAEAFRRSKETHVFETVACLSLSHEMRSDILENGLPYLGAVGKRRVNQPRL